MLGLVWEGQLELSWSQPAPCVLYQFCQGENAIHGWLGFALLCSVYYPLSPPSIHFLSPSWDYEEKCCSSRRDSHSCVWTKINMRMRRWLTDTHITRTFTKQTHAHKCSSTLRTREDCSHPQDIDHVQFFQLCACIYMCMFFHLVFPSALSRVSSKSEEFHLLQINIYDITA